MIAALCAIAGVGAIVTMAWLINHGTSEVFTAHYQFRFTDLSGRRNNLANLRQTGNIYVPFAFQSFTYPPGAILFFWPITWLPAEHLTLLWTLASMAALAGSIGGVLHYLFRRRVWWTAGLSCWLTVGAAALTPPFTNA